MKRLRPRLASGFDALKPLDWKDAAAIHRWLHVVRCQIHRAVAIATDNHQAPALRILPRGVARAELDEVSRGLRRLLRAATIGLTRGPSSSVRPGGGAR